MEYRKELCPIFILPDFLKFNLNKRGVSFLGECIFRTIIATCLKVEPSRHIAVPYKAIRLFPRLMKWGRGTIEFAIVCPSACRDKQNVQFLRLCYGAAIVFWYPLIEIRDMWEWIYILPAGMESWTWISLLLLQEFNGVWKRNKMTKSCVMLKHLSQLELVLIDHDWSPKITMLNETFFMIFGDT